MLTAVPTQVIFDAAVADEVVGAGVVPVVVCASTGVASATAIATASVPVMICCFNMVRRNYFSKSETTLIILVELGYY